MPRRKRRQRGKKMGRKSNKRLLKKNKRRTKKFKTKRINQIPNLKNISSNSRY
jgi:hypothetical protein